MGLFVSRDPGGGKVDACASQVLAVLWDRARRDSLEGSSWPRSRWASVPQQLLDLSELWDLCREACPRAPCISAEQCLDIFGAAGPQSQGVPFPGRALPHGKGCRMCCHTTCGISCCWHAWGGCGHAADAIEHVLLSVCFGEPSQHHPSCAALLSLWPHVLHPFEPWGKGPAQPRNSGDKKPIGLATSKTERGTGS